MRLPSVRLFYKLNPDTALAPFVFHLDTFGPGGGKPYVFSYDSCRVPWRTALDYLWYGTDETGLAHDYPHRNAVWFSRYMESLNWDFDRVSERFCSQACRCRKNVLPAI